MPVLPAIALSQHPLLLPPIVYVQTLLVPVVSVGFPSLLQIALSQSPALFLLPIEHVPALPFQGDLSPLSLPSLPVPLQGLVSVLSPALLAIEYAHFRPLRVLVSQIALFPISLLQSLSPPLPLESSQLLVPPPRVRVVDALVVPNVLFSVLLSFVQMHPSLSPQDGQDPLLVLHQKSACLSVPCLHLQPL